MQREKTMLELKAHEGEKQRVHSQLQEAERERDAFKVPLSARSELERQVQALGAQQATDARALATLVGEKQQADAKLAEAQRQLQALGAQQTHDAQALAVLAGEKEQADAKLAEAQRQLQALAGEKEQADAKLAEAQRQLQALGEQQATDAQAHTTLAGEKEQADAKLAEAQRERDMFKSRLQALEATNAVPSSNVSKCSGGHTNQHEDMAMAKGKKELEELEQKLFNCSQEVHLKKAVLKSQRQQLEVGKVALERSRADFQQVVAGISAAKQERASIVMEIPRRLGIQIQSIDDVEKRVKYLESELSKYKSEESKYKSEEFKCKIMEPWSGQKKTFTEAKEKLDKAMEKARKLDDLYACFGKDGRSVPTSLGQLHRELKAAHETARIVHELYAGCVGGPGAAGKTDAQVRKALEETRSQARVLAKVCEKFGSKCTPDNVHMCVQALLEKGHPPEHSEAHTGAGGKRARTEHGGESKTAALGVLAEGETVQKLRALLRARIEELATLRVESSSAMAVAAYVEGHEVLQRLVHAFRTMKLADEFRFSKGQFHHEEQVLAMMQALENVMCSLLKVRCYFKAIAGDKNRRELAQKWMRDPNSHDLLSSVLVEKETNQVVCPLKLAQECHATGAKVDVTDKSVSVQRITLDGREMSNALFERRETYDCELQRAWTEIKLDVRAEVPALSDMLHPCPAAKNGPASAGQHAQVAVFRQELERLRSQA